MPRERTRRRRAQNMIRSAWWVAGAAVAAAAIMIAISPRALPMVSIPIPVPRPYAGEGKTLGAADAPVTLEEYSDFQ